MLKDTLMKLRSGKRTQFNTTKYIKQIFGADVVPYGKIGLEKD